MKGGSSLKKRIEGLELASAPPSPCPVTEIEPTVRLQHGLTLDDGNMWSSPTLILGVVGSGKSTLLQECMEPIMKHAARVGDATVVFCAKPELLRYARSGDIVIDSAATDPQSCWDIFSEMDAGGDPIQTLREISLSLFAEAEEKTREPFFPQAAEHIFFETSRFLYDRAREQGHRCDNAELVEFLTKTPLWDDGVRSGWLDFAKAYPDYFGMLPDYLGDGNAQGMGVLSEIRLLTGRTLCNSFARAGGYFSARRAIREGKTVYLHYDYERAGRSSLVVLKTMLDLLLKAAMSPALKHKAWFFLDEFALLPKSETMTDALLLGRDPGSDGRGGVRIVAAMQSARLMMHHYTRDEGMALLSLFPNVLALRVNDPMSRDVITERYGKARYLFSQTSVSGRDHTDFALDDVVSDRDFAQIAKKGQGIFSLPGISEAPFFYDGYYGDLHSAESAIYARKGKV